VIDLGSHDHFLSWAVSSGMIVQNIQVIMVAIQYILIIWNVHDSVLSFFIIAHMLYILRVIHQLCWYLFPSEWWGLAALSCFDMAWFVSSDQKHYQEQISVCRQAVQKIYIHVFYKPLTFDKDSNTVATQAWFKKNIQVPLSWKVVA